MAIVALPTILPAAKTILSPSLLGAATYRLPDDTKPVRQLKRKAHEEPTTGRMTRSQMKRTLSTGSQKEKTLPDDETRQKRPYGLISLFDGTSHTIELFTRFVGIQPSAVLLAECDPTIRTVIADVHQCSVES